MYSRLVRLNGRDDLDEFVVNEVLRSSSLLLWVDVQFTVMMGDAFVGELRRSKRKTRLVICYLVRPIALRQLTGSLSGNLGHTGENSFWVMGFKFSETHWFFATKSRKAEAIKG